MTVIRLSERPRRVDTVTIAAGTVAEETNALKTIIGGDIECVRLTDGAAVIVGIEHTDDGDIFTDCPEHIVRSLYA